MMMSALSPGKAKHEVPSLNPGDDSKSPSSFAPNTPRDKILLNSASWISRGVHLRAL